MQVGLRVLASRARASSTILRIVGAARAVAVAAALVVLSACYTYAPAPVNGSLAEQHVEFRFSDAGRVTMQRALGPGALTISGRVVAETDALWTVKVYRLTTVDGAVMTWAGEEIDVSRDAVAIVSTRQFDRQRSLVAAAGVTGAVATFILTRSLLGGGIDMSPGGGGDTGASIRR
jgi:hypothetical protein